VATPDADGFLGFTGSRPPPGWSLRAEAELQEAGAVIANGYLRLDHAEWIRVVETEKWTQGDSNP
jgi:hypothetical protein